jgi:hypothetical protein
VPPPASRRPPCSDSSTSAHQDGGNSPPVVRVLGRAPTSGRRERDGADHGAEGEPHERRPLLAPCPGLRGETAQHDFEAWVERLSALRIFR